MLAQPAVKRPGTTTAVIQPSARPDAPGAAQPSTRSLTAEILSCLAAQQNSKRKPGLGNRDRASVRVRRNRRAGKIHDTVKGQSAGSKHFVVRRRSDLAEGRTDGNTNRGGRAIMQCDRRPSTARCPQRLDYVFGDSLLSEMNFGGGCLTLPDSWPAWNSARLQDRAIIAMSYDGEAPRKNLPHPPPRQADRGRRYRQVTSSTQVLERLGRLKVHRAGGEISTDARDSHRA